MQVELTVENFLKEKLNVTPPPVAHCRRLGRRDPKSPHPRPLLVAFESLERKMLVMRKKKLSAGTKVYINNAYKCTRKSSCGLREGSY